MNVEQIQALIARLRKLVPEQGQWTTLAESACKDAADALEKLLPKESTPTESLAFDYAIAEVNRKLGQPLAPVTPEPYGVIVCHKRIPNATQDFIPARFYREGEWGDEYSKVPVYVTPVQWKEPVATLHDDGYYTWHGAKPNGFNYAGWRLKVYADPIQEKK